MTDPHGHLTHKHDALGNCYECGCPQFGAVVLKLECPVTDQQFADIWDQVEKHHPGMYSEARVMCTASRKEAKRRKAEEIARSAGKRGKRRSRSRAV